MVNTRHTRRRRDAAAAHVLVLLAELFVFSTEAVVLLEECSDSVFQFLRSSLLPISGTLCSLSVLHFSSVHFLLVIEMVQLFTLPGSRLVEVISEELIDDVFFMFGLCT